MIKKFVFSISIILSILLVSNFAFANDDWEVLRAISKKKLVEYMHTKYKNWNDITYVALTEEIAKTNPKKKTPPSGAGGAIFLGKMDAFLNLMGLSVDKKIISPDYDVNIQISAQTFVSANYPYFANLSERDRAILNAAIHIEAFPGFGIKVLNKPVYIPDFYKNKIAPFEDNYPLWFYPINAWACGIRSTSYLEVEQLKEVGGFFNSILDIKKIYEQAGEEKGKELVLINTAKLLTYTPSDFNIILNSYKEFFNYYLEGYNEFEGNKFLFLKEKFKKTGMNFDINLFNPLYNMETFCS
jgi:hypothetical protein